MNSHFFRTNFKTQAETMILERFKKYCSRLERGFLGFGEASAKE